MLAAGRAAGRPAGGVITLPDGEQGMRTLFMSSLAVVLLLVIGAATPAGAAVRITELMADPASDWDHDGAYDYKLDEWIEVTNTGTAPVNLQDYWFRDESASEPRFQLTGVLDPGETAVFYGSDAVAWQAANGISTAGFSLNNGGDTLYLMHGPAGGDLEIIQSITYPDHTADDDRSYGTVPGGSEWMLYDGLFPYTGTLDPPGSGCNPTPGEPNYCHGLVPDEDVSFGTLKATFM